MSKIYAKGIDVSKWQGEVNFTKVKADGYSFVIINAGYGRYINQKDPYFEQNYKNAKSAGLGVGAYWYSYAKSASEARQEAEIFMQAIDGKKFDYPLYYDIEDSSQVGLPNSVIGEMVDAFCSCVESHGYYAGLYSFANFFNAHVPEQQRKRYDIWVAAFDVDSPAYNDSYGMWQFTDKGNVNGVSGSCDCSYAYKDYPSIINGMGKTNNTEVKADTITPFDKYFAERIGVGIDYDGVYGVMCFDLANDYSVNLIGGKAFVGMSAYEIYTNFNNQPGKELYERIPNTPEFVPQKGDIMVWGTGIGENGHVAICNGEGDTTWFNSYDQNWGGKNEPVTLIKHNYNAVLGVLRPKDQTKVLGTGGLKGDANGDGKIDVSDIAKIAAHIKGVKAIDKKYADNADVDGNGRVDVGDIAAVSAHIKGVKAIKQDKPVEKPKPVEKKEIVYIVRKGDTLSSIAAEYGTSWAKIAEDNDIENANLIYVGQKLVIK